MNTIYKMNDEEFEKWLATPIDELPEADQQAFRELDAVREVCTARRKNEELWRGIPGFSKYEASTFGRIRGKRKKDLLSFNKTQEQVTLVSDQYEDVRKRIHLFIAAAFLPNSDDKKKLIHLDGNKFNNNISNLMWSLHSKIVGMAADRVRIKASALPIEVDENGEAVWKVIPSFPKYEINKMGQVRNRKDKKLRKVTVEPQKRVTISLLLKNGKSIPRLLHRLVAETFLPNPDNKPEVNHIDGNIHNNELFNLEWVTKSENIQHAFQTGLNGKNIGSTKAVKMFTLDEVFICEYESVDKAAKDNNVRAQDISKCCKGQLEDYGDFIWKYSEQISDEELQKEHVVLSDFPEYKIYRSGKIYSVKTHSWITPSNTRPYRRISLTNVQKKKKLINVHRLMALAFVQNSYPANYDIVDHIDGDKWNNDPSNLRWCNSKMNANNSNTKKDTRGVKQYSLADEFIREFPSLISAQQTTGVKYTSILKACKRDQMSAGGYKWKYVE